jgi:hypothetical protein
MEKSGWLLLAEELKRLEKERGLKNDGKTNSE